MLNFKIKQLLLLLIVFNCQISGAQEVPNQTPPTPEAFKFTQYGEIPVNESSGNASVDIPLYTFKAGKINIPISMFHSGGAVKVDEANSWTGINWQLNVGGLITRTVNDLVDENTSTGSRLLYSSTTLSGFRVNQSSELVELAAPTVDSEVDIFNYSFPGHSGSFYLDENLDPRLIKYDKEIKISRLSSNAIVNGITTHDKKTITITTADGTKYYFGGVTASESTTARSGAGDFSPPKQTGFYLFKIENFLGDIVTFTYSFGGSSMETVGYSERFTVDVGVDNCSSTTYQLKTSRSGPTASFLETTGKVKLVNITSNRDNSKVTFQSSLQNDNLNRFVLNDIIIYNDNLDIHKKVVFDYITPNTINTLYKRFYLDKIKIFEGTNTTTDNIHSFQYNHPELLPDRFSKAQDYAGYYNGRIYNNSYIPKTDNPFYAPYQAGFANKFVSFEKASYGSLSRVIYPTKGFTDFEYETGKDLSENIYAVENRYLNVYHQDPSRSYESDHDDTDDSTGIWNNEIEFNDSTLSPVSVLNTAVPIKVSITATTMGDLTHHHFLRFTLHHSSGTDIVKTYAIGNNGQNAEFNYSFSETFTSLMSTGVYTFKLEYYKTTEGTGDAYPDYLNAVAHVTFGSNTLITPDKPGIRIKKIKNYTYAGAVPLITRYYYNKFSPVLPTKTSDSQYLVRIPNFEGDSMVRTSCPAGDIAGSMGSQTIYQRYIQSDTQNNIYISNCNNSIYEYVTVSYGGDNFEKGAKEIQFFVQPDGPPVSLTFSDGNYASIRKETNSSLKNGTILKETYYSSKPISSTNSNLIQTKIKEVINTYSLGANSKDHKVTNCLVSKVHDVGTLNLINTSAALYTANYYYGFYFTYSWWHALNKTITKEYFPGGAVESITEYFYDSNLAGLPSRILNTSVGTLDTFETKNTYPPDILSEPSMEILNNQYRIEQPVIVKSYKKGELLSTQKTVYGIDDSSTGSSLTLPIAIQSLKGGNNLNLENRVVYHRYDSHGNVLEASLQDGTHIAYIWGYNKTLPVAKIENRSYEGIPLDLISAIEAASSSSGSESALILALKNLRNSSALDKSKVTTYTYKPLIGISTVTDPNGKMSTYEYDSNNRLKLIRDDHGHILSENQYNYRPN